MERCVLKSKTISLILLVLFFLLTVTLFLLVVTLLQPAAISFAAQMFSPVTLLAVAAAGLLLWLAISNIRLRQELKRVKKQKTSPLTAGKHLPKEQPPKTQLARPAAEWMIVGDSVIGANHVKFDMPCQDGHYFELAKNGWGIAIVADGAGSAKNSHVGARFVAEEAARRYFGALITQQGWQTGGRLPSAIEWQALAKEKWKEVRGALEVFAQHNEMDSHSLACTAIVVIFSPRAILTTHIGDGRAGYRNDKKEWKPLITPYKGEEANATVFLTSALGWQNGRLDEFIESRVIREPVTAFTLMSDGCEKHAFECSRIDENGIWSDPNRPYPGFFEPLLETLVQMKADSDNAAEIQAKWKQFLESGNEGLQHEPDDKTLILGILLDQTKEQEKC